jgi:hypothetical protein
MKSRRGYLVLNIKNLVDRAIYTYKKGVMEHTGASKTDMLNFKEQMIKGDYLIVEVDIRNCSRIKGNKHYGTEN